MAADDSLAVGHVARRDQHQPPAAEQSGVESVGGVEMDRAADHQQIGFGGVEGDIGLDLAFIVAPGDRRRSGRRSAKESTTALTRAVRTSGGPS